MPEPTDDELIAAWNACVDPACDDWKGDEVAIMRCALDADTPDAMRRSLRGSGVGPSDARNRLADELCRRFPQPITEAVLSAEGFNRTGGEGTPYLLRAGRRLVIAQDMRDGVFEVQWSIDQDCEIVRDARRLRELVAGLELVYGRREG